LDIIQAFGIDFDLDGEIAKIKHDVCICNASADYVASRGEYLMAKILAKIIGFEFVDPIEFMPLNSKRNYCGNPQDIKKLLEGRKVVIPGFYGYASRDISFHMSHDHNTPDEVLTFSRGGSDITGAIVAAAIGAKVYENWTDVSGMLMSDPRIVKNPCSIETLTYRELRELSYMGANVFHEVAMFPVQQAGIPTNILNTNEPEHPGTMVVLEKEAKFHNTLEITGIAGRKDFVIINIEKTLMNQQVGFVRKILTVLEVYEISFEHIPSGIDTLSIIIDLKQFDSQFKPIETIVDEIRAACKPDKLEVFEGVALIAVVGCRMSETLGVASKILTAVALEGINVRMINQGSSEISVIIGVKNDDYEKAIRALYAAFVQNSLKTMVDKLKKFFGF